MHEIFLEIQTNHVKIDALVIVNKNEVFDGCFICMSCLHSLYICFIFEFMSIYQ